MQKNHPLYATLCSVFHAVLCSFRLKNCCHKLVQQCTQKSASKGSSERMMLLNGFKFEHDSFHGNQQQTEPF